MISLGSRHPGKRPSHEIRAVFDAEVVTVYQVYQVYPDRIAESALRAGTFVDPFKRDRMTWVKPARLTPSAAGPDPADYICEFIQSSGASVLEGPCPRGW